jgi:two-component system cell cycle response regulator
MLSKSSRPMLVHPGASRSRPTVLLATADSQLKIELLRFFGAMDLRVEAVIDSDSVIAATRTLADSAVILLDVRLADVASGRLLAGLQEPGVHRRCAIALIAEAVCDEWIARLREGVIDDIVPRNADAAAWSTHLSTMLRGHQLLCELEQLREASLLEVQRDRVTGVFNRGTMLTILFRETDRVQRLHGSLCLVLFAIDDFRYWTSELGRDAGDRLLQEAAARAGRMLRSYDLLGRTGHDEFLMALPGCSTVNAAMTAERLRTEVSREPFMVQDGPQEAIAVRLTVSCGVTSSRGRSPVVVLREVEQVLALSRRAGPDSIRCAGETEQARELSAGLETLFPGAEVSA